MMKKYVCMVTTSITMNLIFVYCSEAHDIKFENNFLATEPKKEFSPATVAHFEPRYTHSHCRRCSISGSHPLLFLSLEFSGIRCEIYIRYTWHCLKQSDYRRGKHQLFGRWQQFFMATWTTGLLLNCVLFIGTAVSPSEEARLCGHG